ncbi:MAG: glycosyl hydrolase, partial [Bacteroidota bacterium]
YSEFVGRSCQLLQGGRRVADVGVLYPFESLAGWYRFEDPANPRQGFFVAPETDYLTISGWLTNALHRDFTFIHPELFLAEKYTIVNDEIHLQNAENHQQYRTLILTGGKVIGLPTLRKLYAFYQAGGTVIATSQLPEQSATRGKDAEVRELIAKMFAPEQPGKGLAIFLPEPTAEKLADALEKTQPTPDVIVSTPPHPVPEFGKFSYIHKVKEGRHIYYFANSSNEPVNSEVFVRGHHALELWDPHTGKTQPMTNQELTERNGVAYTRLSLDLSPVRSVFFLSRPERN